ncbi:hypothetical protein BDQ17DRAFT_1355972 [Cyathus striatus]|nr:hypothetical protein BDQ17DRAFT_1355972 [Cyathus striatus]
MPTVSLPLIPEILRLICEQLYHKPTLASLARTCTAFENPALDTLWFELDEGFYPLAKCLPSDLWVEVERKDKNHYIVLRYPLVPEDCTRIIRYAKRVYRFSFESIYGSKHLLPNIRSLIWRWHASDYPGFFFVYSFLGPHLTKVVLHLSGDVSQYSVIPTLYQRHPALKHVELEHTARNNVHEVRIVKVVSNFVYKWHDLEILAVTNITYSALLEVSLLPSLTRFEISEWIPDNVSLTAQTGTFPVLNYLVIASPKLSHCVVFFEVMDSSPIKVIDFSVNKKESPESWRSFFNAIREHCRNDTLQKVISSGFYDDDDVLSPEDMPGFEDIKPLLAFHDLRHLSLTIPQGFYLSDSTATKEMARSWTKITQLVLKLPSYNRSPQPSKITLLDLLPFAEHCPYLSELAIFLDATSPPELDELILPGNGISQTSLIELQVGDSPGNCPTLIAAFLSGTFPSLEKIVTMESRESELENYNSEDEEEDDMTTSTDPWIRAQVLLDAFSAIRKQERLRAASQSGRILGIIDEQ